MTPKEKAQQLFYKYNSQTSDEFKSDTFKSAKTAKQCALIAVDEILRSHNNLYGVNNKQVKFYSEVKKEIEKL